MPRASRNAAVCAAAICTALSMSSAASAQAIDINGGNSWGGWSWIGGSQSKGSWVRGSTTRTFNMYSASFVLSSGQAVAGTRLSDSALGNGVGYTGDTNSSLFVSSWRAGDRIIGLGVQYLGTTRGSIFHLQTDKGGDNMVAASSFGATDGVTTFGQGDTSAHITTGSTDRGKVRTYSVYAGFSADGGANFLTPYGTSASVAAPTRSFAVLDSGSSTRIKSLQYFINIDAVLRSNGGATFGEGDLSATTRFGLREGESGSGNFTQQTFVIPAPTALALLGFAGVLRVGRRR